MNIKYNRKHNRNRNKMNNRTIISLSVFWILAVVGFALIYHGHNTYQCFQELNCIKDVIKEIKNNTYDQFDVCPAIYVKYGQSIDNLIKLKSYRDNYILAEQEYDKHIWRMNPNQKYWLEILENQSDRQILWVIDDAINGGGLGKSKFCDYMEFKRNAGIFDTTDLNTIGSMYNYQPYVLFDFPRDVKKEEIDYGVIEGLKSGRINQLDHGTGSGYGPGSRKRFIQPRIGCFSNFVPDLSKFSQDRWHILRYNGKGDLIYEKK